jgi:hypothetical protein
MENDMKGKVMGVDAANRRKNAKLKVTASGGANPGANLKPLSKLAPKGSIRPRTRSDKEAEDEADATADRAMKHSQPPKLVYKAAGGAVKKMAMGGAMHKMPDGTMMKGEAHGMAMGGKLKMVEKDGKKVPSFAADGVGKMAMGGMCRGMGAAKRGGSYKG